MNARVRDYRHAYALLVHLADGPKRTRLQTAIDSGDAVEIMAATLAARFGLKGYDPNEPRDPHSGALSFDEAQIARQKVKAENEVLLPRDSRFEVVSVSGEGAFGPDRVVLILRESGEAASKAIAMMSEKPESRFAWQRGDVHITRRKGVEIGYSFA